MSQRQSVHYSIEAMTSVKFLSHSSHVATSLLVVMLGCRQPMKVAEVDSDPQARVCVARASVVFVGILTDADFRWSCVGASLATCTRDMAFRPRTFLKGSSTDQSLKVTAVMLPLETKWMELKDSGRGRLSPRFFRKGHEYIVAAEGIAEPDGTWSLGISADAQLWLGSRGNIEAIRKLVRDGSTKPDRGND